MGRVRRALAWCLTLPLVAASVLAGHAAAYAVTGEPLGDVHGYLEHGPQLALVLATLGLVGVSLQQRSGGGRSALPYALVAASAFACQEHVERLAHGDSTLLLSDPTFLVGLALQLPVVVACLALARCVIRAARGGAPWRAPAVPSLLLAVVAAPSRRPAASVAPSQRGRAPPALLR
jgi:hypothetical protein